MKRLHVHVSVDDLVQSIRFYSTLFAFDTVLTVPACLSLWARRRYPVAVGWVTVGAAFVSDASLGAALVWPSCST